MYRLIRNITVFIFLGLSLSQCDGITSVDLGKLQPFEDAPPYLSLALNVSQHEHAGGKELEMQMVVTNTSDSLIRIGLPYYLYNFRIARADSTIIWDRVRDDFGRGNPIPSIQLNFELGAGDTLSYHHSWDQKDLHGQAVEAGSYIVLGMLDMEIDIPEERDAVVATDPAHIIILK